MIGADGYRPFIIFRKPPHEYSQHMGLLMVGSVVSLRFRHVPFQRTDTAIEQVSIILELPPSSSPICPTRTTSISGISIVFSEVSFNIGMLSYALDQNYVNP